MLPKIISFLWLLPRKTDADSEMCVARESDWLGSSYSILLLQHEATGSRPEK